MESRNTSGALVPNEEAPAREGEHEGASPPTGNAGDLDIAKYWSYVEQMDLTDDQRIKVLQTLWGIMTTFADLGFGIDPVQQAMPALVYGAMLAESDPEAKARHQFNDVADSKEDDHEQQ